MVAEHGLPSDDVLLRALVGDAEFPLRKKVDPVGVLALVDAHLSGLAAAQTRKARAACLCSFARGKKGGMRRICSSISSSVGSNSRSSMRPRRRNFATPCPKNPVRARNKARRRGAARMRFLGGMLDHARHMG